VGDPLQHRTLRWGSIATNFLAAKSKLLKPIASGLKLIALFVAIQTFLFLAE